MSTANLQQRLNDLFGYIRQGKIIEAIVLPHLISGQFVEHCNPAILQRVQPSSSLRFSRDIQAHSLVTLVRDPRRLLLRWVLNTFSGCPASS